jgi:head-tail adaptor
MSGYAYPDKHHKVTIYSEKTVKWRNESASGTYLERVYHHAEGTRIWAYIRQIAATTEDQSEASFPANRYLIVINFRPGIKPGDFIESGSRTFKILFTDEFEGGDTELKLTCQIFDKPSDATKKIFPRPAQ